MEHVAESRSRSLLPVAVGYLAMIAATALLFLIVRHFGESLVPAGAIASTSIAESKPATPAAHSLIFHVLLALAAVIAVGRVLGVVCRYLGQPPVIGEVIGGILLGPSLLGWLWPAGMAFILPAASAPALGVVAQLGIILYMFCVGLELDTGLLRERGHAAVAISHASIMAPFSLGVLLALWLYPIYAESHVSFTSFSLFLGAAMSVTAFPVLARILTDRGMSNSRLGVMALTCAAVDDVTAWCLLAVVISVAQAHVGGGFVVLGTTIAYLAVVFFLIRPIVQRWSKRYQADVPPGVVATVFLALLLSSLVTELIGIHAIFGAFLLGAVFPNDSRIAREMSGKLKDLVTVLLLPAFFAFTGMRTQIDLVSGWNAWLGCLAIIAVATLGKLGGTMLAARWTGCDWRDSASLGILMNTRGLMELVVLNIGLDLQIISPTLFAMMVIMAIVTTVATTPALWMIEAKGSVAGDQLSGKAGSDAVAASVLTPDP